MRYKLTIVLAGVLLSICSASADAAARKDELTDCAFYGTVARTKGFVHCQVARGNFDRAPNPFGEEWSSCGRGRIRDPLTHECRGRAQLVP